MHMLRKNKFSSPLVGLNLTVVFANFPETCRSYSIESVFMMVLCADYTASYVTATLDNIN